MRACLSASVDAVLFGVSPASSWSCHMSKPPWEVTCHVGVLCMLSVGVCSAWLDRRHTELIKERSPAPQHCKGTYSLCNACRTLLARPTPQPSLELPSPGSHTHPESRLTSSLEAPMCPSTRVLRSSHTGMPFHCIFSQQRGSYSLLAPNQNIPSLGVACLCQLWLDDCKEGW